MGEKSLVERARELLAYGNEADARHHAPGYTIQLCQAVVDAHALAKKVAFASDKTIFDAVFPSLDWLEKYSEAKDV